MPITATEGGRAWFIETPASLYAIALDSNGLPAQRHWGSRLPHRDWAELLKGDTPRWISDSSRPAEVEQEILADGGLRWGVPGLQVIFHGANQSLELIFGGAQIHESGSESTLVLTLKDSLFPFWAHLHYRIQADSDVIERWVEIESGGDAEDDVVLLRADSANWFVDDTDDYWYSSTHGQWAAETQLKRGPLPIGDLTFTSRTGTTSHQANPWIMIHSGSATETSGLVRTMALGWSGSWHLTAQHRPEGGVSVSTGFGHEGVHLVLKSGERHVTPPSYGLATDGGFGETSRKWHAFVLHHLRPSRHEVRPVLYNSWEATGFEVSETNQMRLAEKAAQIGAEVFVLDDGWFGSRTNSARGLGDWYPNPARFPNGLHALTEHVRGLGMGFGLWVEPEMANPDSDLYREHPDWVLNFEGRSRLEARNQLVLNFARDDVKRWALDWLDDLVSTYRLDFLKWDMNRPFSQAGWPDEPCRQGSLWLSHTRAVYDIMRTLRARHPSLRIESCTGGGGRVDLGMMEVVDQFWTSDNTDALDRQTIQHGFSQLYPVSAMCNWVTDSPNPTTKRAVPLEYRFHVAMAGALSIGADLGAWTDEELDRAAAFVQDYKEIRDVIQLGALHRLDGTPGVTLSAVQYLYGEAVVILSYEPRRSLHRGARRTTLHGLEPNAGYLNHTTGRTHSGGYLMERGLVLHDALNTDPSNGTLRFSNQDYLSALTTLTRVDQLEN
ncbi:alpha-galactosidase [Cryobacterium sp. MP_3.1]|uniref:alpha-galactosidase n=1 Tax=Cryobacterium sp. MP_3.1 TaxID=3071711 RepID=UPI002E03B5EC|nr:alpha-galactosidase [Cryobacterium sp. MP_3.1]